MTILKIKNIKHFMSLLLSQTTFDQWLVSEAAITTHNTFRIDGTVNKDFFDDENRPDGDKISWQLLRPICFCMIKGQRTPTLMKLIFCMNRNDCGQIIQEADTISTDDVNGLFINLHYENGRLSLTTGSSLKIFTLDKSLDEAFERFLRHFLSENGIEYEENL